jgi:hypothetical protein
MADGAGRLLIPVPAPVRGCRAAGADSVAFIDPVFQIVSSNPRYRADFFSSVNFC